MYKSPPTKTIITIAPTVINITVEPLFFFLWSIVFNLENSQNAMKNVDILNFFSFIKISYTSKMEHWEKLEET